MAATEFKTGRGEPEPLTVRPVHRRQDWSVWLAGALGPLGMTVAFTLKYSGAALVALLCAEVAVAAALLLVIELGRQRIKFVLNDRGLIFVGRLGKREVFREEAPGRVVELKIIWLGPSTKPLELWALLNAEGVCEAAVNASSFDQADLETLRRRLNLTREVVEKPLPARSVRDSYPNVIPWWAAHLVGLYVGAFLLAVAIVALASRS